MFTTGLRPKNRVRRLDADDLAVSAGNPDAEAWLLDSHGAVCLVPRCGARGIQPAGMIAHREGCRP